MGPLSRAQIRIYCFPFVARRKPPPFLYTPATESQRYATFAANDFAVTARLRVPSACKNGPRVFGASATRGMKFARRFPPSPTRAKTANDKTDFDLFALS